MNNRPDIAVFSSDDRLQLVVDVKELVDKTADWAAHMRRNLLAHAAVPAAPFFMLVLPDHMWIWKDSGDVNARQPDLQLDTAQVLRRYLPRRDNSESTVGGSALELSLVAWLEELSNADPSALSAPWTARLAETGLLDCIRNGEIRVRAAV